VLAAGVNAVSCAARRNRDPARVQIVRAAGYNQDLFAVVLRMFRESSVDVRGKRVVVKPNLVEFDSNTVINTSPIVVHAAVEALAALGAASVTVAEGPGHRRVTMDLAEAAGYFSEMPGFEKRFVDLNIDSTREVKIQSPRSTLRSVFLPETILGAELLVSIPKLKTHHWVGATLSMKNLFGIVPGAIYGWPKNVLHWAGIAESIVDLWGVIPEHFCLVDGITGMEGNGPIQGTPKHAGVLVAGADMPAVDATCCRIMRLDPDQIPYLEFAGGAPAEADVIQTGETIASVATPFAVLPQWDPLRLRG
jgi:uncharacterized protein (DUF362 family)